MPPIHSSLADVAAAYRTLIAHETEPKEQDFYRTRLQRFEPTTEPECEFDCRSRVAAAGVGVYCPPCSAKCADTDLATQLARAIRAAWVDRLDWDELAQGALEFLSSTGRLVPAGGMALAAEQVEDVKVVLGQLERGGPAFEAAHERLRALFPATEPAAVRDGSDLVVVQRSHTAKAVQSWMTLDLWTDLGKNDKDFDAEYERQGFGDLWATLLGEVRALVQATTPVPAEPAEEETKAELCAVRLCVLPARHSGVHADREGLRWNNPTSSPVVPAPTETGPWPSLLAVPVTVQKVKDAKGYEWHRRGSTDGWRGCNGADAYTSNCRTGHRDSAPFVAAEEG